MANHIKPTPTLYGKEAIAFLKQLKESKKKPLPKERIEEIFRNARLLKSMLNEK